MEKKELKDKLKEVESLIKTNSKDAHYAETLISELKSLHGQLKHEPTLVHIPLDSVEKSIDGETYTMSVTKDSKAVYHAKGGYTLICDSQYAALFDFIESSIDFINGKFDGELEDKYKDILSNDISSSTFVLNLPLIAMGDVEFKYKMIGEIIDYLNNSMLKAEKELQEETPEADKEFKTAVLAMEHIKDELNSEINEVKD